MFESVLAISFVAAAPSADIGDQRNFGNWAVGCDNGWHCQAQSLDPEGEIGTAPGSIMLWRDGGGDAAPRLAIHLMEETQSRAVSLRIDGGHAASATWSADDNMFVFDAGMTRVIIPMMADGARATLHSETGADLGGFSLSGSAAAMRYIDDIQHRAGTRTALVARGDAPASLVPVAPAIPVIAAPALSDLPAETISNAEALAIQTGYDCFEGDERPRRNESVRVSAATTLLLVSCGSGAYNFNDFAFVIENGARRAAAFDAPVSWGEEISPPLLVNAMWNAEEGTLDTYAKGRGIGDCGTSQRFTWDGTRFRLIAQRVMNECRGSIEWIPVYRATVERDSR